MNNRYNNIQMLKDNQERIEQVRSFDEAVWLEICKQSQDGIMLQEQQFRELKEIRQRH